MGATICAIPVSVRGSLGSSIIGFVKRSRTPSFILVDDGDDDCRIDFDEADSCGTNALTTVVDSGNPSKPTTKISKATVLVEILVLRDGFAPSEYFRRNDSDIFG